MSIPLVVAIRWLEYTRQVHRIVDGKREMVDIFITRTITNRIRKFQAVISPKSKWSRFVQTETMTTHAA
jgi:hypothetical protein